MSENRAPITWQELRTNIDAALTPEEQEEIRLRVEIIGHIIDARNAKGLSQRDMEALTGLKQPTIARFERGTVDPQLSTLLRILKPLGFRLDIVPDNEAQH